jgi:hypothetical protein
MVIDKINLDFRGLILSRLAFCITPASLGIVKWRQTDSVAHVGTYALGAIGHPLFLRVGKQSITSDLVFGYPNYRVGV